MIGIWNNTNINATKKRSKFTADASKVKNAANALFREQNRLSHSGASLCFFTLHKVIYFAVGRRRLRGAVNGISYVEAVIKVLEP